MKYPSLISALLIGCPLLSGQGYQAPFFSRGGNCSSGFFAEVDYLAWYAYQSVLCAVSCKIEGNTLAGVCIADLETTDLKGEFLTARRRD